MTDALWEFGSGNMNETLDGPVEEGGVRDVIDIGVKGGDGFPQVAMRSDVGEADAVIEREAAGDAPVVLREELERPVAGVEVASERGFGIGVEVAEQRVGET